MSDEKKVELIKGILALDIGPTATIVGILNVIFQSEITEADLEWGITMAQELASQEQ